MSWMSWIPTIIEGIGLLKDKDSASRPENVEPLDLEALTRLMMTNTKSPWGGMEYSQGDDGRYTAEYSLGQTQPIFDRAVDRSLNPDQAYQMPDELRQLQSALMQQRLGNVGAVNSVAPRPERRQYQPGGGQFQGPFAPAGSAAPAPQGSAPSVHRDPVGDSGGFGAPSYGYGSGYGLGAGGSFGTAAPMFGGSGGSSGGGFNDYLNRIIPGAEQGTQLSPWREGALDNAGAIGHAVSAATGIPGLGTLGNALTNRWYMNNALQNPLSGRNEIGENIPPPPPSGNDMVNEAVRESPYNMGNLGAQQSGIAAPMEYYGNLGSWQGFQSGGTGPIKWFYSRSMNQE